MQGIVVYTKNNCPACERAKSTLMMQGKSFLAMNVDNNPEAMDFIVEQNIRTMPAIFIDGVYTGSVVK